MTSSVVEEKVLEFFKQLGYSVKLHERILGSSGVLHEVDLLAVDESLEEVRIACRCVLQGVVDEDVVMLWAKICEDIHAIPSLVSATGYTDSALKLASNFNFILLTYDEKTGSVSKVSPTTSFLKDEVKELVLKAREITKKVKELKEDLHRITLEKGEKSEEYQRLENIISNLLNEAENLYRRALELRPDKSTWLELAVFYETWRYYLGQEDELVVEKMMECYFNALKEHLKGLPSLLKGLGSLSLLDEYSLMKQIERVFGIASSLFTAKVSAAKFQLNMLRLYLETNEKDVDAWLRLAEHYGSLVRHGFKGYKEEFEKACERAFELDPNNPMVIARLATLYRNVGASLLSSEGKVDFLKKSIEMLRKRCKLEPKSPFPWLELADIYRVYGEVLGLSRDERLNEAIRCMEEAASKFRLWWSRWKMLGDLYFEKGNKEKALEYYSKAIDEYISIRKSFNQEEGV